jgi:hypothetical protein
MAVKKIDKKAPKRTKTVEEEKLESDVEELIDCVETDHPFTKKLQLDWAYFYSMYLGYQSFIQNYEDNELQVDELESENRSTYNIIDGFVDTYVAKMMKDKPIPQFYPLGFESKDINAARYSNIALEAWWKKMDIHNVWYDIMTWAGMLGIGIIKQYWNGPQTKAITNSTDEATQKGDIVVESVLPWNFYPDPRATSMKNARYVIHAYPMPITTLKKMFPDSNKLTPEVIEDYRSLLSSYTAGLISSDNEDKGVFAEKCVLVREYWERGVEGFDAGQGTGAGRYIIRASGEELYSGPNPYGKSLPFIVVAIGKTPDQFCGRGIVEKLAPEQHDLNRINSLIMENIDWTCIVKYAAPRGINLEDNAINKKSGEVILYDADGGGRVHQIEITPMPNYVFEHKGAIFSTCMDRSGMHEVSFAQLPPRTSGASGKALEQLVEAEATRFAHDVSMIQAAMEEQALFFVELAQEYYPATKHIAIMGRNRSVEIADFKKTDLRGQTGCFVEVGSGLGLSPTAKNDRIIQLYDRKIIGPEDVLKASEFGTSTQLFYKANMDENKANRHLQMILEKHTAPNISKYDNHQAIIRVFRDFVRKPEYDELDDKDQQVIEAYMDGHIAADAALAADMQRIQKMAADSVNPPQQPEQMGAPGQPLPMQNDQTQQAQQEQLAQAQGSPQIAQPEAQGGVNG